MSGDAIDFTTSVATHIEPMAGAGLALCVGCLNLARFRYRSRIRDIAEGHLEHLSSVEKYEEVNHWPSVELLERLAKLPDNDAVGEVSSNGAKIEWEYPSEFVYALLFSKHFDRWLCTALAIYCIYVLHVGTVHNAAEQYALAPYNWFAPGTLIIHSSLMIAAVIVPPLLSGVAWFIIARLRRIADKARGIMAKTLAKQAGSASLPDEVKQ